MLAWAELTEQEQLISVYSDLFKDVHGFRPRGLGINEWSVEELRADIARLEVSLIAANAQHEEAQQRAIHEFEARVISVIATGAGDRETAIRWIADAEQVNGDMEYLCYLLELPFSYFKAP